MPDPGQALASLIAGLPALVVALIGWGLHVRECRANTAALRAENARLLDALERALERRG